MCFIQRQKSKIENAVTKVWSHMYLVPNYFLIAGSWNTPELWVKANEIRTWYICLSPTTSLTEASDSSYDWVFTLIAKSVILLRKMSNSTIHNDITGPAGSILNLSTFCKKKSLSWNYLLPIPFLSLTTGKYKQMKLAHRVFSFLYQLDCG